MSKSSHGPKIRDRVWSLLKAIVTFANDDIGTYDTLNLSTKIRWKGGDRHSQQIVVKDVTKHDLAKLTEWIHPQQALTAKQVSDSLKELRDFLSPLQIFEDNCVTTQSGTDLRHFILTLWFQKPDDTARTAFNQKWESCRQSPTATESAPTPADRDADTETIPSGTPPTEPSDHNPSDDSTSNGSITQTVDNNSGVVAGQIDTLNIQINQAPPDTSSLQFGAPFPKVRLPDNYVDRPDALHAVKAKLLEKTSQTLVISAISGLGGLGKSVLATALVLDSEVQERFADGILWVTLGQNPNLLAMLVDWIRELDRSRDTFSANTLESASRYLRNLLIERRMLLVIDDVWNAAHAEWFLVGGPDCRVLVTTREARIAGAAYHALDLMSEEEAIALVRNKLKDQWTPDQDAAVKAFAKSVGYLPLALDLATNQVQEGLSWAELQAEFESERRTVALELLDATEAWDQLSEEAQRQYSLRACFNLSLKRLTSQQLQQFAWLGVLPEDVRLEAQMASVLWDMPLIKAKKTLITLRQRSLITDGVATFEGDRTYRVHDLMHDTACSLIEEGILQLQKPELVSQNPKLVLSLSNASKIQNLSLAHQQFLQRYRQQTTASAWEQLPNDGYIHRHLFWHLERAGWCDEIHQLMAKSDPHGHNAWFEACDRIGQPAIFVESVATAWRIAEQSYQDDPTQSIILQCRYALITATLNSLVNNLPIELMAELVKQGFWTVEQAWAYVEQIQDEQQIARAIEALQTQLTKPLLQVAIEKAQNIKNEASRGWALGVLAQTKETNFKELLTMVRDIREDYVKGKALKALACCNKVDLVSLLNAIQTITSEHLRTEVFQSLAQCGRFNFNDLIGSTKFIQDKVSRAYVLSILSRHDEAYFTEALEVTRSIQSEYIQVNILKTLIQCKNANYIEFLEAAKSIQCEFKRVDILITLAQHNEVYFTEALEAARAIQNKGSQAYALCKIAQHNKAYFMEALEAARSIQDEHTQASVLGTLAKCENANLTELLKIIQTIHDKFSQAHALSALAQNDEAYFLEALETTQTIKQKHSRVYILGKLAKGARNLIKLLEITRSIQDEYYQASALAKLAKYDVIYFNKVQEIAQKNQDVNKKYVLIRLAKHEDNVYLNLNKVVPKKQTEFRRRHCVIRVDQYEQANFTKLLETIQTIQNEHWRAHALSMLAQLNGANLTKVLKTAQKIQNKFSQAYILTTLVKLDFKRFLPIFWQFINESTNFLSASRILSKSLSYFPLGALPFDDPQSFNWQSFLHLLAFQKRSNLMLDLTELYPAIALLGGETAMRSVIDEMQTVCSQWK